MNLYGQYIYQLSPFIGVFVWSSACFIAQNKSKPQIAEIFNDSEIWSILSNMIFCPIVP